MHAPIGLVHVAYLYTYTNMYFMMDIRVPMPLRVPMPPPTYTNDHPSLNRPYAYQSRFFEMPYATIRDAQLYDRTRIDVEDRRGRRYVLCKRQ